jgi:microcystin-dependent protein
MKRIFGTLLIMALVIIPVLADDVDTMTVTTDGKVGISNQTPRAKLDVNGRIMDKTGFVMPVGTILPYGGTTAPTGWLLCNGTAYSRTGTYADLFTAIGTAFGAPDSNNFNVPDLRGQFLRGVNNASGVDPDAASRTALKTGGNTGDNVGSKQGDTFASHTHNAVAPNPCPAGDGDHSPPPCTQSATGFSIIKGPGYASPFSVSQNGGNETRPKNVYVNFIIKY